jgi:hypothetical protein
MVEIRSLARKFARYASWMHGRHESMEVMAIFGYSPLRNFFEMVAIALLASKDDDHSILTLICRCEDPFERRIDDVIGFFVGWQENDMPVTLPILLSSSIESRG